MTDAADHEQAQAAQPARTGSPRGGWVLLAVLLVILLAVIGAIWIRVRNASAFAKDEEMFRTLGNGFEMYHKKYGAYPCLVDVSGPARGALTPAQARHPGGQPATAALRLLRDGGFVEDVRMFFSPRDVPPSNRYVAMGNADIDYTLPATAPFFATYAYDPGHTRADGRTVLFGNRRESLNLWGYPQIIVLDCELTQYEWEPDTRGRYVVPSINPTAPVDDLYADDSPTLGWKDSFLVCDSLEPQP